MKRLTSRAEDGTASVDPSDIDAAIARLAAYEDMRDDLAARLADLEEDIAARKAAGALNASAANRLVAQKVALKTTIGMFDVYGIE